MVEITAELLARYDRPVPRYTSYPTAVEFTEAFGPADHEARLVGASERPDDPLSLYLHLPFCDARCSFCACHVVITQKTEVADAYLQRVLVEADRVADRLGERHKLAQYHWGGGTPTHHTPEVMAALHSRLTEYFEILPGADVAIEVDPRVTTFEHLATLDELGFNRLSLGVQDLDPRVQDLIGRNQTREETEILHAEARRLGFESINFDLIYGLPGQSETTMAATLDAVVEMRPDRLAVYSFALVPWMRPHQKRMDEAGLPSTEEKFALLAQVIGTLTDAGYVQIGMDHFALPTDSLARAAVDRTLTRNFMGYTTIRGTDVVALGSSGISDVDGAYAQNHRRLASYYDMVDSGELPVERGYRLNRDDQIRRYVITELMCNNTVNLDDVARLFDITPGEYFAAELATLTGPEGLVSEGMVTVDEHGITATELGGMFVRRVATVFDSHREKGPSTVPVFSRSI